MLFRLVKKEEVSWKFYFRKLITYIKYKIFLEMSVVEIEIWIYVKLLDKQFPWNKILLGSLSQDFTNKHTKIYSSIVKKIIKL